MYCTVLLIPQTTTITYFCIFISISTLFLYKWQASNT